MKSQSQIRAHPITDFRLPHSLYRSNSARHCDQYRPEAQPDRQNRFCRNNRNSLSHRTQMADEERESLAVVPTVSGHFGK